MTTQTGQLGGRIRGWGYDVDTRVCLEHCEKVNELYATIMGNGKAGMKMEHASLMEWREREEKRAGGNRKMLWLILLVLLPIAVTRVLDYTSTRQQQPMTTIGQSVTTHTDSQGNDSYSTTDSKSTSEKTKK
jgi:hypothetical protein